MRRANEIAGERRLPESNRWKVPVDDAAYGIVCPECASPKHRQSRRCAACFRDVQRARHAGAAGRYDLCGCGVRKLRASTRCRGCYSAARRRGEAGPRGRQQPQTHPWRGENALLFQARRVSEMANAGIRPATAAGRLRAHFAALAEEAA